MNAAALITEFEEKHGYFGVTRLTVDPDSHLLLITGALTLAEITEITAAYAVLAECLKPTPQRFWGRCPICGDITEAVITPRAVACKWGGCNGTVEAMLPFPKSPLPV